jgi:hypothetical protein
MGFFHVAREVRIGWAQPSKQLEQLAPCEATFERRRRPKFRDDMSMPLDAHDFARAFDLVQD